MPQCVEPCAWVDQVQCTPRSAFTCVLRHYLTVAKTNLLLSNSIAHVNYDALYHSRLVYCAVNFMCRCTPFDLNANLI